MNYTQAIHLLMMLYFILYFTTGCTVHATFNISGHKELTWKTFGGCEINEYCDLKNTECKRGNM